MKPSDLFTIISQVWFAATIVLWMSDKPAWGAAIPAVFFAILSWVYAWSTTKR
jgi:hypothetical protein